MLTHSITVNSSCILSSVTLFIFCFIFFFSPLFPCSVYFLYVVATGLYPGVVKLQKMRCLFEAYEHVLSLLENVFTPMFCHSDEVINTESSSS